MLRVMKRLQVLSEVLYIRNKANSDVIEYAYSKKANVRKLRALLLPLCHGCKALSILLTTLCIYGCGDTQFDAAIPTPIATVTVKTTLEKRKLKSVLVPLKKQQQQQQQQQQQ